MLAGEWVKACALKETVEYCQQTCDAPVEASDPAAWGRARAECWDERGLNLRGSLERWSWESCSETSYHLEIKSTKLIRSQQVQKVQQRNRSGFTDGTVFPTVT